MDSFRKKYYAAVTREPPAETILEGWRRLCDEDVNRNELMKFSTSVFAGLFGELQELSLVTKHFPASDLRAYLEIRERVFGDDVVNAAFRAKQEWITMLEFAMNDPQRTFEKISILLSYGSDPNLVARDEDKSIILDMLFRAFDRIAPNTYVNLHCEFSK